MRAFMSDVWHGYNTDESAAAWGFRPYGGAHATPKEPTSRAEDEARRILAETEPQTRYSSTFSPITMYRPQSSRSERGQMHAALAEALAAFVADGVSE